MIGLLAIPEERKAVLIGKGGAIKKDLEKRTKTKIKADDIIEITGNGFENVTTAKEVVKAIGRGFAPEKAFILLNNEYQLNVITLKDHTPKAMKRIMSRVIGRNGSAKRKVEELTESCISVYGKTVSIIAKWDRIGKAVRVVEMILQGKPHSFVYSWAGKN